MKNHKRLLTVLLLLSILLLFCVDRPTNIYIGNYSFERCEIDLQIMIDDEIILNDNNFMGLFLRPVIINKQMKCGFHHIYLYSQKAKVNKRERIFLCPFQYINIEFLQSDILCKEDTLEHDFIIIQSDTLHRDTLRHHLDETSNFIVCTGFPPFYTE